MSRFISGLCQAVEKKDFWSGIKIKNNEKLVDSSGFVPLDIRFKKLDIATAQRKLALSQFDYHDYDELYDDDIVFNKYDSLEELQDKLEKYTNKKKEILANKFAEYRAQRETEANAMQQNTSTKSVENTTTQTNSTQKPTE